MSWQQCRENSKAIKQPVVYIDIEIYEYHVNEHK
jgi:hypothetical protein